MSGTLKSQEGKELFKIGNEMRQLTKPSFFPIRELRDISLVTNAQAINKALITLYNIVTKKAEDDRVRYEVATKTLDDLNEILPDFQRVEPELGEESKQFFVSVLDVAGNFLPRLRNSIILENPDLEEDIRARFAITESAMEKLQGDYINPSKNKVLSIVGDALKRTAPIMVLAIVLSQIANKFLPAENDDSLSNKGNRVEFVSDDHCMSLEYPSGDCALSERFANQAAVEGIANFIYSSTAECEGVHGKDNCNRRYDDSDTLIVSPNLAAWSAVAENIIDKSRIEPLYASAQEGMMYLRSGEHINMVVSYSVK